MVNCLESKLKSRNFKICFLNICSMRRKMNDSKILCCTKNPDILALNETWLYSNETKFFNIKGYQPIYNCRNENRGGGSAVFIRNNIKFYRKL